MRGKNCIFFSNSCHHYDMFQEIGDFSFCSGATARLGRKGEEMEGEAGVSNWFMLLLHLTLEGDTSSKLIPAPPSAGDKGLGSN